MDLSAPFESMFPTVDSSVLTVLAASSKPRTGRAVAAQANRSQRATKLVLERLVEHGLVLREEVGRSHVYTLNREHLAATPIAQLATLRPALFGRMREAVGAWHPQPLHASVFGSAARGDGDLGSDVDIFLVRPGDVDEDDEQWRTQVEDLADAVFRWTGNQAGIAEVGKGQLERLRRDKPAIVASLREDGVDVVGTPIRSLLRGI